MNERFFALFLTLKDATPEVRLASTGSIKRSDLTLATTLHWLNVLLCTCQ